MNHSELQNDLYAALCSAQEAVEEVRKNAVNPHYKSEYADLAEITRAIKKAMAENGLSIVENAPIQAITDRYYVVDMTLRLCHASGQWMELETHIPCMKGDRMDAQSVGAAITYGRRYLIQNLFNIAAEPDDDGNSIIADKDVPKPANTSKPTEEKKMPSRASERPQNGKIDASFAGVVTLVNPIPGTEAPKPAIMKAATEIKKGGDSEEEYATLIENIQESRKTGDWSWV